MTKRKVTTYIDEELWKEFVELSISRSMKEEGSAYGAIAKAMEEAIRDWIKKRKE